MPIYEYACVHCGKTFEKIQRSDLAEACCPDCGQPAGRIVSRPAAPAANHGGTAQTGCGKGGFS